MPNVNVEKLNCRFLVSSQAQQEETSAEPAKIAMAPQGEILTAS
jgi:hypothetical protein